MQAHKGFNKFCYLGSHLNNCCCLGSHLNNVVLYQMYVLKLYVINLKLNVTESVQALVLLSYRGLLSQYIV